jgi:hypothetical protein
VVVAAAEIVLVIGEDNWAVDSHKGFVDYRDKGFVDKVAVVVEKDWN